METAQSIDDHLDQRSNTRSSKHAGHRSLTATNSASSLTTPTEQQLHRKSHPPLSTRYSASDSRLSSSLDNVKNPKKSLRSKNRLRRLDLSLDSANRHGRHDPNSTLESTEDEDRTSADEYSTEDDGDGGLRSVEGDGEGGNSELRESVNSSLNSSSSSFVDKAVEELITTERTYVRDLHDVIQVAQLLKSFQAASNVSDTDSCNR